MIIPSHLRRWSTIRVSTTSRRRLLREGERQRTRHCLFPLTPRTNHPEGFGLRSSLVHNKALDRFKMKLNTFLMVCNIIQDASKRTMPSHHISFPYRTSWTVSPGASRSCFAPETLVYDPGGHDEQAEAPEREAANTSTPLHSKNNHLKGLALC